ncbi:non-hydrolyzing UDP-N-acetylglucosamine 2-epimerase [Ligilactobacillus sp.]|uniref:non-hydrolyzing UDP-N-acetylglucosamine 2-epimerase n=1 Tax=Ligilactobacillus sp. TaxID=2767921 RepID=UPI002FE284DB
MKIKVMTVFGTRPEAIKMAPLVLALKADERFEAITAVTAQHREMLDSALEIFKIKPDYDLNLMHKGQTLQEITADVMTKIDDVIKKADPDIILVHGDTTTTFAAALAGFYNRKTLGHVEAGLRTWNKYSPFPEEMNRQMTDDLCDIYFAPTELSRKNLLRQNHPAEQIYVTGNTAIDAMRETIKDDYHHEIFSELDPRKKMVLLTMHRRENQGSKMKETFEAIREVVLERNDVQVVYPVHLSPRVQETAHEVFDDVRDVHLINPLDVVDFHNLQAKSSFIMSDSGGVQEEAPALKKPVLVLRDTTERPEGVSAGTLKLVGTNGENVKKEMIRLLDDEAEYQRMANARNPYGDGHACERILDAIAYYFKQTDVRPRDFM